MEILKKKFPNFNWTLDLWIFIPYTLLSLFGLVMVYSSSSYFSLKEYGFSEYFLYRQIIFVFLGMVLMLSMAYFGHRFLRRERVLQFSFLGVVFLLIAVLFTTPINGARSWLQIPLFGTLQPSELAKIIIIWGSAYYYSNLQAQIEKNWIHYVRMPAIAMVVFTPLIMLQPDFGTMAIIFVIYSMMLFMSGISIKWFYGALGVAAVGYGALLLPASFWELTPLRPYQISRITAFHNPFADAQGAGYQIIQGFYALARGEWFGTGVGTSIQKTGFLPESQTDFILAIVGEELGIFMLLTVVLVLFGLIIYIFKKALDCKSLFSKFICMGVGVLFMTQASINIAAVAGLAPITGVPLPFISYGGSYFMVSSMAIGLVQCAIRMDASIVAKLAQQKLNN